jgi:UDP-3-O-[3-hydroxymyristoyl] N-acetylglucosamine deacetylase
MYLQQRTLQKAVSCSGIGVHSGKKVNVTIKPAPVNHGIKFKRVDLPDRPSIAAHFNMVVDTSLATVIGYNGFIISTIEHLMASFAGYSIDNALVEVDAYEMPIMDGSAAEFIALIESAGVITQAAPRCFFVVNEPIKLAENGKSIAVYPSSDYRITYTIDYDHPLLQNQSHSVTITDQIFNCEICKARTFGFLHEYDYLKRYSLAKGVSLDNVVVIDKNGVINEDGLRYENEFVRHKILDCIGDLSLLGMPILGHIVVKKSGHAFNHAFLNKFFTQKQSWETHMLSDLCQLSQNHSKALAI